MRTTPAEVAEAARGTVAFFSEFRAEGLGIVSEVSGRGEGVGMNIAGGAAEVQAQALEYGLTPAEVAQSARGSAGHFGRIATAGQTQPAASLASALLNRGKSNSNKATTTRNLCDWASKLGRRLWGQRSGRNTLRHQPGK